MVSYQILSYATGCVVFCICLDGGKTIPICLGCIAKIIVASFECTRYELGAPTAVYVLHCMTVIGRFRPIRGFCPLYCDLQLAVISGGH